MALGEEYLVSYNSSYYYCGRGRSILVWNCMSANNSGNVVSRESGRGCLFEYVHVSLGKPALVLRRAGVGIRSVLHNIWIIGASELVLGSTVSI